MRNTPYRNNTHMPQRDPFLRVIEAGMPHNLRQPFKSDVPVLYKDIDILDRRHLRCPVAQGNATTIARVHVNVDAPQHLVEVPIRLHCWPRPAATVCCAVCLARPAMIGPQEEDQVARMEVVREARRLLGQIDNRPVVVVP